MTTKRLVLAGVASAALAVLPAAAAQAAKPVPTTPTPSAVCSILVEAGKGGYTSFGDCKRNLRGDMKAYRFFSDLPPFGLIDLWQRCAELESFGVTYPYTFTEEPMLTAHNRGQCANQLFLYHTLFIDESGET
jgi:opacity protein-like surface antigen